MPNPPAHRPEIPPAVWEAELGEHRGGAADATEVTAFGASDLLSFLGRRKASILGGLIAVLAVVALYTHFTPPTFESDVTFLVEAEGGANGAGGLDLLSQLGRGRQIETEIELIRSRLVLSPVVDGLLVSAIPVDGARGDSQRVLLRLGDELPDGTYRLSLEDPDLSLVLRGGSASVSLGGSAEGGAGVAFDADSALIDLPSSVAAELVEDAPWRSSALSEIATRIRVGRIQRDADLIRLTCEGENPRSARRLCSAIEASYLNVRHDLERAHAATTRQLLTEQLSRIGKQLRDAENDLTAYSRRNRVIALDDQASAEVREQTDLQARRDVLESERVALAEILDRVEDGDRLQYRDLAAFPSFIGSETVTDLMASLLDLENRRSELAVTRTDQSREVQAVDARIASIEGQLHSTAISYERALAAQVSALDQAISEMGERLATIPDRRIAHARLERQAENLAEVYTMLEGRMQEARIAESVNLPTVRVVDSATLPSKPSSPSLPLNLALGTVAGLALGLGLAFVREQLDSGLRGRKQVEQETGLSVLSMVPQVERPGPVLAFSVVEHPGHGGLLTTNGNSESRRLRRLAEKAVALEAYRSLAIDLNFATRVENGDGGDRGFRSLAVTSASRGEGKTLTACNLAIVHASAGHRTLLVDTDVRASGVSRFFGLGPNDPGLSDVLGPRRYDARSVRREVWIEGGARLSLMLSGPPARNSASLFEGDAFDRLLKQLQREFDLVIFDTPPLSLITDAAAIAASVDSVLVVVRSGVTEKETLDYTLQRIRRVNGHLLGVVLNGVRARDSYAYRYEYLREEPAPGAGAGVSA